MAEIWKRIKNSTIKKLGGYTEKEYRTISDIHYEFIPQKISNIITLRSSGTFYKENIPSQDWIEEKLLMGIVQQMKPYARFVEVDDPLTMQRIIYGYVKVVVDND